MRAAGGEGRLGGMDLRGCATSLWILAALHLPGLVPAIDAPGGVGCPEEERRIVVDDVPRGRLPLLLCPAEVGPRATSAPEGHAALLVGRRVDLNRATEEELAALPGIGPGLAFRIAADREERGPFSSLQDLGRVKGIGAAKLRAIEGLATASGDSPRRGGHAAACKESEALAP